MFGFRRAPALALATFCLAGGCEKKTPAAPPAASRGLPPLGDDSEVPRPGAQSRLVHAPTGEAAALAPGHPPMGEGAGLPPGHPPTGAAAEPAPFDPKLTIDGVLRLDDKVKDKVAGGETIFLVARAADPSGAPGPILAVKKLTAGRWPLAFSLDGRDAMMVGTKLSGRVVVSARVDKDGDAITKNPGDVVGSSRPVEVPASKVVITLDSVL